MSRAPTGGGATSTGGANGDSATGTGIATRVGAPGSARAAAPATSGVVLAAGVGSDDAASLSGAISRLTATDTETTNVTAPATSMASGPV